MLLLVDDRCSDPDLARIKRHLLRNAIPKVLTSMFMPVRPTTLAYSDDVLVRLGEDGPPIASSMIDGSEGILKILEDDPDDVCMIMERLVFFSGGISEVIGSHKASEADVTVLVKEMPALPGLMGITLDEEMDISYVKREGPVRANSIDLNVYVMRKDVLKEMVHSETDLRKLDVKAFSLLRDDIRIKGYRIRSKVGFTDDLISLLETQRMVMDAYPNKMEKAATRNLSIGRDQILNMPVYISGRARIGPKCRIGPYVTLLGDVTIGENVFISNSIVCEKCVIEDDVYLDGAIIGPDSVIEKGSEIEWSVHQSLIP